MEEIELAKLVKRTRDAQRAYFRTRDRLQLEASKRLERELDEAADEILGAAAYAAGGQEWADWNAGMLNFD
jgi:K+/H+ antiporter YhaU regulatory subunit KhtT